MRAIASLVAITACATATADPAKPAPALSLGAPLAPGFLYVVRDSGVYANPFPSHRADGKPRFAFFAREEIQVARIDPPLATSDHFEIASDGSITGAARDGKPRTLTVLVPDPRPLLLPPPRTRAEFLALGDDVLAAYVNAWLADRALDQDGRGLTPAERDVMWSEVAFVWISDDGFEGLFASFGAQLPEIRDALRRVGLGDRAKLIDRSIVSPRGDAELDALYAAWEAMKDDPDPTIAAYIRAHADDFAWAKMVP
jgi:hypothetical protein